MSWFYLDMFMGLLLCQLIFLLTELTGFWLCLNPSAYVLLYRIGRNVFWTISYLSLLFIPIGFISSFTINIFCKIFLNFEALTSNSSRFLDDNLNRKIIDRCIYRYFNILLMGIVVLQKNILADSSKSHFAGSVEDDVDSPDTKGW